MALMTHKGWFGVCPVYIDDPGSYAPMLVERHWVFTPLMWASELIFAACAFAMEMAGSQFPGWPIRITGELDPPIEIGESAEPLA